MQAAHFHFCLRDAPLSMLKIKFRPFSFTKLARSDKDQWRKLQSCFCQRQSVVILDGSEQRADTRWINDAGPVGRKHWIGCRALNWLSTSPAKWRSALAEERRAPAFPRRACEHRRSRD